MAGRAYEWIPVHRNLLERYSGWIRRTKHAFVCAVLGLSGIILVATFGNSISEGDKKHIQERQERFQSEHQQALGIVSDNPWRVLEKTSSEGVVTVVLASKTQRISLRHLSGAETIIQGEDVQLSVQPVDIARFWPGDGVRQFLVVTPKSIQP